MRYTPARCYVLELVEAEELTILRDGALAPSIDGFGKAKRPFSQKHCLNAVHYLRNEGLIDFREQGLLGVYKGKAELTAFGEHCMPTARARQTAFTELAERRAAERLAFEQKRAEELAAFAAANQVLKADEPEQDVDQFQRQPAWAAERVRAFLDRHAERNIAEKSIIFRIDDHVLHAGDLALLCDTVLGAR